MAWPVLAAQFLKKPVASNSWSSEKCYISIFVYLTAVHNLLDNLGLVKVWLTQGLTVTRYIARSRCLLLMPIMDLVIIQIIRIFPDYRLAWMLHLLWQFERRSWLFSTHTYFIVRIFVKWLRKAQSAKETFVSEMWFNVVKFPWSRVHQGTRPCTCQRPRKPCDTQVFQFSGTQQKWYSWIHTGMMVVLGKLLDSVSINPVLSTIKLFRWFVALYNQLSC